MSRAFRDALGMFATGVTVVSAAGQNGEAPVGMTVSSFNSVSLDPPLVLFSVDRGALSLPALRRAPGYAVSVLAVDQVALSKRFAGKGIDKWAGLEPEAGFGGAPLVPGAIATFECRPYRVYDGGDHVIFVGEVVAHRTAPAAADPLVFFGGAYRSLATTEPAAPTAGTAARPSQQGDTS